MAQKVKLKVLKGNTESDLNSQIEKFKKDYEISKIKKGTNIAFMFYYTGSKQLSIVDVGQNF